MQTLGQELSKTGNRSQALTASSKVFTNVDKQIGWVPDAGTLLPSNQLSSNQKGIGRHHKPVENGNCEMSKNRPTDVNSAASLLLPTAVTATPGQKSPSSSNKVYHKTQSNKSTSEWQLRPTDSSCSWSHEGTRKYDSTDTHHYNEHPQYRPPSPQTDTSAATVARTSRLAEQQRQITNRMASVKATTHQATLPIWKNHPDWKQVEQRSCSPIAAGAQEHSQEALGISPFIPLDVDKLDHDNPPPRTISIGHHTCQYLPYAVMAAEERMEWSPMNIQQTLPIIIGEEQCQNIIPQQMKTAADPAERWSSGDHGMSLANTESATEPGKFGPSTNIELCYGMAVAKGAIPHYTSTIRELVQNAITNPDLQPDDVRKRLVDQAASSAKFVVWLTASVAILNWREVARQRDCYTLNRRNAATETDIVTIPASRDMSVISQPNGNLLGYHDATKVMIDEPCLSVTQDK